MALLSAGGRRIKHGSMHAGRFNSFAASFTLPSTYLGKVFSLATKRDEAGVHIRSCGHPAFSVAFRGRARDCQLKSRIRMGNGVRSCDNIVLRSLPIGCVIGHSIHDF